jgi:hypothetical protein
VKKKKLSRPGKLPGGEASIVGDSKALSGQVKVSLVAPKKRLDVLSLIDA